jgi:hypothetical protein
MTIVTPQYTRNRVNRAGTILADARAYPQAEQAWAEEVLTNWRTSHGYPINTFQATLRAKLKKGYGRCIVAQRLKRAPSMPLS